jgi:hypothetical protein
LFSIKATDGVEFPSCSSKRVRGTLFNNERVDHAPFGRELGPLLYGLGAWSAIEDVVFESWMSLKLRFYRILMPDILISNLGWNILVELTGPCEAIWDCTREHP